MLTTHPSIMLGSYLWDEDRLPRDEFDIRLAHLRAAMERNGWAATLIYGDARDHEALAFFTNFIPRMRWALAILPAKGPPRLLAAMSSRDMPAMRTMTWIPEVYSGWEWKWFDGLVETLPAPGSIGTIGFDLMTPVLYGQVEKSLAAEFSLEPADELVAVARATHRPRETALIRAAAEIVGVAGDAILASWRSGKDVENAALDGERAARGLAAQDVRTLVSRDGGRTLQPYRARFDDRPEIFLGYVAVKFQGYWAERFVTDAPRPRQVARLARDGLAALLAAFRPGLSAAALHDKVATALGSASRHPVPAGSLGHRIGLSLNEGADLTEDGHSKVLSQTVYALRVGALDAAEGGAIASAMALVRGDGSIDVLTRSDPA
jgi:Xaa-Pro aminopeptidase